MMADIARPELPRMTRAAYREWATVQPNGRYELIEGIVVRMAAERLEHARIKAAVWLALRNSIVAAGVACEALPDGITVEVGDDTDYVPDAMVNCGERAAPAAIAVQRPVIVVEVSSPSTVAVDKGLKLAGYFRVPSIHHYLLVRADRRAVIHHRRRPDGDGFDTRILSDGLLKLDPPGLRVGVDSFYAV